MIYDVCTPDLNGKIYHVLYGVQSICSITHPIWDL